ncbi:nitrogenase-stabilizing/protective protein NifW [Sorangium sp. So ce726]
MSRRSAIVYRGRLAAEYHDFVSRSPLQERLFKVLKDAVPRGRA